LRSAFASTPRACEPDQHRILDLARLDDVSADLVSGSRRAIIASREAIAEADKLLFL
jgi:hypothetical protein